MVTLKILAQDIMKNHYASSMNCPITRALRRAGYMSSRHTGLGILVNLRYISEDTNESIRLLNDKVIAMYKTKGGPSYFDADIKPIPIEDFEMAIDIEEPCIFSEIVENGLPAAFLQFD